MVRASASSAREGCLTVLRIALYGTVRSAVLGLLRTVSRTVECGTQYVTVRALKSIAIYRRIAAVPYWTFIRTPYRTVVPLCGLFGTAYSPARTVADPYLIYYIAQIVKLKHCFLGVRPGDEWRGAATTVEGLHE